MRGLAAGDSVGTAAEAIYGSAQKTAKTAVSIKVLILLINLQFGNSLSFSYKFMK